MASIKGKNTKPELVVRKFLHRRGFRFSLHRKDLPGTPDIVLRKWAVAVFVNGCYWHRHDRCRYAYDPKSNVDFWVKKFQANVDRDAKNYRLLKSMGWKVVVVWECEVKSGTFSESLEDRIRQ